MNLATKKNQISKFDIPLREYVWLESLEKQKSKGETQTTSSGTMDGRWKRKRKKNRNKTTWRWVASNIGDLQAWQTLRWKERKRRRRRQYTSLQRKFLFHSKLDKEEMPRFAEPSEQSVQRLLASIRLCSAKNALEFNNQTMKSIERRSQRVGREGGLGHKQSASAVTKATWRSRLKAQSCDDSAEIRNPLFTLLT